MSNLTSTIKSIQDILRKNAGVDGDAQRISQFANGSAIRIPMRMVPKATM